MALIDVEKKMVDSYPINDIINYVLNMHLVGHDLMRRGIDQQNLALMGEAEASYKYAESMLKALDEKLNGQKVTTVL